MVQLQSIAPHGSASENYDVTAIINISLHVIALYSPGPIYFFAQGPTLSLLRRWSIDV